MRVYCGDDCDTPVYLKQRILQYFCNDCNTLVSATASKITVLVGEDTDLLALCLHEEIDRCDLCFLSESKLRGKQQRIWHIKRTKNRLGLEKCQLLPVVHALSGCNTTFRLFGVGKSNALSRLSNDGFVQLARTFFNANAMTDDITKLAENALIIMYSGHAGEGLNTLKYHRFCEMQVLFSYISYHQHQRLQSFTIVDYGFTVFACASRCRTR